MFVPDPVISLALKPVGKESPNFSRALNRFQKEDPTFRVHIDHESKEVRVLSFPAVFPVLTSCRQSSPVWESFTWIFTSSACDGNIT